jgi:hypothetical protein
VLDALGKTVSEIRSKLGESLITLQKFDTPPEQATTPSLEARKAYDQRQDESNRTRKPPPRGVTHDLRRDKLVFPANNLKFASARCEYVLHHSPWLM